MADMPRPVSREPWDLTAAFIEAQMRAQREQEKLLAAPELAKQQHQLDLSKLQAASDLRLTELPQELAIKEPFQERASQRDMQRDLQRIEAQGGQSRENIRVQGAVNRENRKAANEDDWSYKPKEAALADEYAQRKEGRAEAESIRRGTREQAFGIERMERQADISEESQRRQQEFQLKKSEEADERRTTRELKRIDEKAAQDRLTYEHKRFTDEGYYNRNPWLAKGMASGKVKMGYAGVLTLPMNDLVSQQGLASSKDFEDLGPVPDPNDPSKTVRAFRDKRTAPPQLGVTPSPASQGLPQSGMQRGPFAPTRQQAPAPVEAPAKAPTEAVPTNKSGDRLPITKSSVDENTIRWRNSLEDAPPQYQQLLDRIGERFNVSPDLLASIAAKESGFNPRAVSPAGAQGLTQFMPETAQRFGVNTRDPASSLAGTAKYLHKLAEKFDGNLGLMLAGYNWGEGAAGNPRGVHTWLQSGADPRRMPAETRDYVEDITGQPIEFWINKYLNKGQRPRVQRTSQRNENGEELFWVDT